MTYQACNFYGSFTILHAIGQLEGRVEMMAEDIAELKADLKVVQATAARWKGAFGLLLMLGAAPGATADLAVSLFKDP